MLPKPQGRESSRAVMVSPLEAATPEPCVTSWFSELNVETSPSYRTKFRNFLLWLWKKPQRVGKMPSELLDFQEKAVGRERMCLPKLIVSMCKNPAAHTRACGPALPFGSRDRDFCGLSCNSDARFPFLPGSFHFLSIQVVCERFSCGNGVVFAAKTASAKAHSLSSCVPSGWENRTCPDFDSSNRSTLSS
jgi:hypothetical protein